MNKFLLFLFVFLKNDIFCCPKKYIKSFGVSFEIMRFDQNNSIDILPQLDFENNLFCLSAQYNYKLKNIIDIGIEVLFSSKFINFCIKPLILTRIINIGFALIWNIKDGITTPNFCIIFSRNIQKFKINLSFKITTQEEEDDDYDYDYDYDNFVIDMNVNVDHKNKKQASIIILSKNTSSIQLNLSNNESIKNSHLNNKTSKILKTKTKYNTSNIHPQSQSCNIKQNTTPPTKLPKRLADITKITQPIEIPEKISQEINNILNLRIATNTIWYIVFPQNATKFEMAKIGMQTGKSGLLIKNIYETINNLRLIYIVQNEKLTPLTDITDYDNEIIKKYKESSNNMENEKINKIKKLAKKFSNLKKNYSYHKSNIINALSSKNQKKNLYNKLPILLEQIQKYLHCTISYIAQNKNIIN